MGRWKSDPPWQHTFQNVFGTTVDNFYEEFATWRSGLSAASIRGRVVGRDGRGLPYIEVTGHTEASESVPWSWDTSYAYTDAEGRFELPVGTDAVVGVDLGGCRVYYTSQGLVSGLGLASKLSPDDGVGQGVAITLTNNTCVWQIRGQLVDAQGKGMSNRSISATNIDNGSGTNIRTEANGMFSITVPAAGQYRLETRIDGCSVYYREGEVPGTSQQATQFVIQDSDVTGVRFQLTEGLCSTKIRGRLLDAGSVGIPDVLLFVFVQDEHNSSVSVRTESDGSFSITVPGAGVYLLQANFDGCRVYFRRGGAVGSRDRATRITIDERDVTGVRFQLREGQCSISITGQLLDADGNGIADAWVYVNSDSGNTGATTDADGRYSIVVPSAGVYIA